MRGGRESLQARARRGPWDLIFGVSLAIAVAAWLVAGGSLSKAISTGRGNRGDFQVYVAQDGSMMAVVSQADASALERDLSLTPAMHMIVGENRRTMGWPWEALSRAGLHAVGTWRDEYAGAPPSLDVLVAVLKQGVARDGTFLTRTWNDVGGKSSYKQGSVYVVSLSRPVWKVHWDGVALLAGMWVMPLVAGFAAWQLNRQRRSLIARRAVQCMQCGYSLVGLPRSPCPECGSIESGTRADAQAPGSGSR